MPPAKLAASLALLGGALWVAHALLGAGSPLADMLHLIGRVCLVAAAVAFGLTLVRSDAVGLRLMVGLASGVLALAVVEAFRFSASGWYDGTWGILAVALGAVGLLRGPAATPARE